MQTYLSSRPATFEPARQLVMAQGWNAMSYQILNEGIQHWFSSHGDAVVGFVRHAGVRVVAGAPICSHERLAAVVEEWEAESHRAGENVCYFGAGSRLEALWSQRRRAKVLLGAQPVWDPGRWDDVVREHTSLRAQFNRARNKGVRISEWDSRRGTHDAALHACLRHWLQCKSLPPLHFLVEPNLLSNLRDRRLWVAQVGATIAGFCVLTPVPARRGWLVEQIVRHRDAPNGTTESLLDHAMRAVSHEAQYLTLGFTPLSLRDEPTTTPRWLRWTLHWLRAHGQRFFNFAGLEAFKTKFQPSEWEPIYVLTNRHNFSPQDFYAITAAFAATSPWHLLARTGIKAVAQEYQWLQQRVRSR